MAKAAGQWHALGDCCGRHRRAVARALSDCCGRRQASEALALAGVAHTAGLRHALIGCRGLHRISNQGKNQQSGQNQEVPGWILTELRFYRDYLNALDLVFNAPINTPYAVSTMPVQNRKPYNPVYYNMYLFFMHPPSLCEK